MESQASHHPTSWALAQTASHLQQFAEIWHPTLKHQLLVQSVKRGETNTKKIQEPWKSTKHCAKTHQIISNLAVFSDDFGCWVKGQSKFQFISSTFSIHHTDERIEIEIQMQCKNVYPSRDRNPDKRLLWPDTPPRTLSGKWERFCFEGHFPSVEPLWLGKTPALDWSGDMSALSGTEAWFIDWRLLNAPTISVTDSVAFTFCRAAQPLYFQFNYARFCLKQNFHHCFKETIFPITWQELYKLHTDIGKYENWPSYLIRDSGRPLGRRDFSFNPSVILLTSTCILHPVSTFKEGPLIYLAHDSLHDCVMYQ